MSKIKLTKPVLIMLYGFPGSGKTHFAREISKEIGAAHLHSERIRNELFESPRYDKAENEVVDHLLQYMAQEFLHAGISVVYDSTSSRAVDRRLTRDFARKAKALPLLIWLQVDLESAKSRLRSKDRRKTDDKYSRDYNRQTFEEAVGMMQNPDLTEEYVVISGKHTFGTQKNAVVKKLFDMGVIDAESLSRRIVKPGMINLVPSNQPGRVDMRRRDIRIR